MPLPKGSLEAEADRLHDLGFWLDVTEAGTKRPVLPSSDRRPDKSLVRTLLGQPGRGLAVNLGRSGLVDLECDEPGAEDELPPLFGGAVPATPTYRSKRGRHRLLRRPAGLPPDAKAKAHLGRVEVRAGGVDTVALSMLPPSPHPAGVRYTWEPGLSAHDLPPAELPDHLAERLVGLLGRGIPATADPGAGPDDPISEGKRNDTLFRIGCDLARVPGMGESAVAAALAAANRTRCRPPLSDADVAAVARSACQRVKSDSPRSGKGGGATQAELLIGLADAAGVRLWHTPAEDAYASVPVGGHVEHLPVRSKAFRGWLARGFYQSHRQAPGGQAVTDALGALDGRGRYDGEQHPVHLRVAGRPDGRIYLDLCDADWRVVEVGPDGWKVIPGADAPVRFRRRKGMRPLPAPEPGGELADLWAFLNVAEADRPLVLAWLVAALRPAGPYPILRTEAEQGSGKSTGCRVLRALVDPNEAPLRSAPRSARDLMIAANNGHVASFDNLSYVDGDLSDALCRLATGGGFATRQLYSDDDETLLDACRPILLNGIEAVGLRPDLMDRSVVVRLPRIAAKDRQPEAVFWERFERVRPGLLGILLDAVAAALRNLPAVQARTGAEWPRMADFAMWAVAAGPALGCRKGEFLAAYAANRDSAAADLLDTNPAIAALVGLLERDGKYEGTATNLLARLAAGQETRRSGWPATPRALSALVNRFAPALRSAGWTVERPRQGNDKLLVFGRAADAPPLPRPEPSRVERFLAARKARSDAGVGNGSLWPRHGRPVPPKPPKDGRSPRPAAGGS